MLFTAKYVAQPVALALCAAIAYGQSLPERIEIVVVQGEGAVNQIKRRSVAPPVVRVQQLSGQPVSDASVVFTLPTEGATGDFDGEKTVVLSSDSGGRAAPKSLRLNAVPGKVPIHVSASYRGLTARAIINQVSVVPPGEKAGKGGGSHRALIVTLLSIVAAAGGGAAYALTQNKAASSAPSTPVGPTQIGIIPGTGTIAGGR